MSNNEQVLKILTELFEKQKQYIDEAYWGDKNNLFLQGQLKEARSCLVWLNDYIGIYKYDKVKNDKVKNDKVKNENI